MKSKRHNGMRRRNGCTPAAEPLEARRMLSIVPLPAGSGTIESIRRDSSGSAAGLHPFRRLIPLWRFDFITRTPSWTSNPPSTPSRGARSGLLYIRDGSYRAWGRARMKAG
jgi:hypothetical protein